MLRRLALAVATHPRAVLAAALAILVIAGVGGAGAADHMKVGGFDDPRSESSRAQNLLDDRFGDTTNLVLQVTARRGGVDAPEVGTAADRLAQHLRSAPGVRLVGSYWASGAAALRSADGRSGLLQAHVGGDEDEQARTTEGIVDGLPGDDAVQVRVGGRLGVIDEIERKVRADLVVSEAIALPTLLILLVAVFGGIVAASMPLAMGVFSIAVSSVVLLALAKVTDVSVYALTAATAFGLGLAIDFALFMVSRFREERDRGLPPQEAVVETVATAGRTILFSGATVALAMAGLLVFPNYFLRSVGLAAIVVVAIALVGAIVVLPAMLALAGDRIDSLVVLRRRHKLSADSPFWRRTAAGVMRRPALAALPVVALLILLAAPLPGAEFAPADERALPADSPGRQVTTALREDYPADPTEAITVVASAGRAGLSGVASEVARLPAVAEVAPVSASGDAGYLLVFPMAAAESRAARRLVEAIRVLPEVAAPRFLVGGPTAESIDTRTAITGRLGLALAVIVTAMFVVLFLFTGSVVVPVKAIALNVLVLAAVLGAMVWLFQEGNLVGLIGVTGAPLNLGIVVLLCAIVFSLSVDYEIFLLSRIKEAHDRGLDTAAATVEGLGRVGRIVTAAAALLMLTLFSFSIGLSFIKMFGIGTGLGILIDATLVRGVLVPAFMQVAGELNWWAPRPLRRLARGTVETEGRRAPAPPERHYAKQVRPTISADPTRPRATVPDQATRPSATVRDQATRPSGTVRDQATRPSETVPDQATRPRETVRDQATRPSETVPDQATRPSETVPDQATRPSATVPDQATRPRETTHGDPTAPADPDATRPSELG